MIKDFIDEYVVKGVRQHYEIFITLWDWELKNKILNKNIASKIFQDDTSKIEESKLNEDCFNFVKKFMIVFHAILNNVP